MKEGQATLLRHRIARVCRDVRLVTLYEGGDPDDFYRAQDILTASETQLYDYLQKIVEQDRQAAYDEQRRVAARKAAQGRQASARRWHPVSTLSRERLAAIRADAEKGRRDPHHVWQQFPAEYLVEVLDSLRDP